MTEGDGTSGRRRQDNSRSNVAKNICADESPDHRTAPAEGDILSGGPFAQAQGRPAASGIGLSVWRAREAKNAETYGSAR
jgi:hypothetical protein